MERAINPGTLKRITSHYRNFGVNCWVKGLPYERCAELTWIIDYVSPRLEEPLQYLDIGTGVSPLPTYLHARSPWNIVCLDKCHWVRKQHQFAEAARQGSRRNGQFKVLEEDLLTADLPAASFDLITCISVIEHFEGDSDTAAIQASARLLKPGGQLILTTLINDGHFAEFYLKREVYGEEFSGKPVYYQRHYDVEGLEERLIRPSGLAERQRLYFGDYGFQCFEDVLQLPKPVRMFYLWSTPWLAQKYLTYRPYPISRREMTMNTASGVILVLEKAGEVH